MSRRIAIPHLDHVQCGQFREILDMNIELYGTGELPWKYEKELEKFFGTTDRQMMLDRAMRMKSVPVLCPGNVIEIVDRLTGDMVRRVARRANMNDSRVARELDVIARDMMAGSEVVIERRLSDAIKALQYLPVEYAFHDDAKGRDASKKVQEALRLIEEVLNDLPVPVLYVVIGVPGINGAIDDVDDLISALAAKGIHKTGIETRTSLRKELIGQPTFDSLHGPMYGGPKKVRYETFDVSELLSL